MDTEHFIALVRDRRCLWDLNDPSYHIRTEQQMSWKEVSIETHVPVDRLKKKWRTLRDTFRKKLKKKSNKEFSNWPFFKKLLFLRDSMELRDQKKVPISTENNQDGESVDISAEFLYLPDPPTEDSVSLPSQDHTQSPKQNHVFTTNKRTRRRNTTICGEQLLEVEEGKFDDYEHDSKDSDYQFFMSLLPYVKQLHPSRRLLVRGKILQVIIDEQTMQAST